jgi:hypothetical protein
MVRILSVDWDFFVEEDPMLDYGHREVSLFLEMIWHTRRQGYLWDPATQTAEPIRRDLTKLLPFRGDPAFLQVAAMRWHNYDVAVAESHLTILQMIGQRTDLEIINVDAHHDIHYGTLPKDDVVHCGNWGAHLMQQNRVRSWTQIYPEWRQKYKETFPRTWAKKHCPKVAVKFGEQRIPWRDVDAVFICRSGCWTPPEYDVRFNAFTEAMGSSYKLPERAIE